jgi:Zn-dependent M28 family amino/carboxypeptidase
MNFSGSAYLYDPSAEISADAVKNKTVVTTSPANYFKLMSLSPETIVYLNQEDFNKAKGGVGDFALKIEGKFIKEMSGNVSAVLYAPYETKKEIILTAHYDSYRTSPGANDNATGVAALIELARLFYQHMEKLTYNLRFVVFGCEEVGLLGSRMYLDRHAEDLRNCILVFNIDTVGGDSEIYAEMLGGMSAKYLEQRTNQFPKYLMDKAWDSKSGKWMILKPELLAPLFTASMVPQHLKEILETTGRELKIKINPAKGLFSDQRTFAQVGIPSTGLAQKTGSKIIHSPNDTPENVNINLVEKAAKICFSVVLKMMPDKTN